MKPRFHRLALEEIEHEVDYYDSRQPSLGAELEGKIGALVAKIVRFPQAAPQWKRRPDRRVAVIEKFPFKVPYQIKGDEVVILALAHTSRRPGYWSGRLEL
jgi:toxin ParE1/3/4